MGSAQVAVTMLLLSLLLPSSLLVLAQTQDTTAVTTAAADTVEVTPNPVTSDPSQERRERLRNFFARKREQRVKPGDVRIGEGRDSKTVRNSRVRPRLTNIRKQEPETPESSEERIETSVSVSSSVSTSSKITKRVRPGTDTASEKPEETTNEAPNRTTRKRFRLIKSPKVNQDELLEKLLANIDLKNEIGIEQKLFRRPSRFRPSLRRDQIRKTAESALKPKFQNNRIRIRKPNRPTEKAIVTTTILTKTEEVEVVTESIVLLGQSEEDVISDQVNTVITGGYEGITEAAKNDIVNNVLDKEIVNEITDSKQNIHLTNTKKAIESPRKADKTNFFRRNSPRRFGFGRKPLNPTSAPKTNNIDEEAVTSNNLAKEENLKFGSFPTLNRLNDITPKAKTVQQVINKPKPVPTQDVQSSILPQPVSNDIDPVFNMIVSESQPKLKLNNRRNQINMNQNTFAPAISQPAFLRPTQFKQPSQIIPEILETHRSISQPQLQARVQKNRIQPKSIVHQPIAVKSSVAKAIIREILFPKFELPDFFNVPFASFQTQASRSPAQQASPGQNNGGALFSGIGQPQGRVQGHPRATNLNIITGSYSVGW